MSLRATQKDTTGRRDMSHHWSGTKPLTRAQRAAAEAMAGDAPSGGGDEDVTDIFVLDWSELDGDDVLGP